MMAGLILKDKPQWVITHPSKVDIVRSIYPEFTREIIIEEDDGRWCVRLCTEECVRLCTEEFYIKKMGKEDNS